MKKLFTILLLFATTHTFAQTIYYIENSGANPNDNISDGAAIQKAIDSADGGTTINYVKSSGGGNFILDETIEMLSNVYLQFDTLTTGFSFKTTMAQTSAGLFRTLPVTKYTGATGVSISITKGSKTFTYPNASTLFAVGDIIYARGGLRYTTPDPTPSPYNFGLLDIITAISGNTITVSQTSPETYTTTIALLVYAPVKNVTLDGLKIDFRGRIDSYGMSFETTTNLMIKNCSLQSDSLWIGLPADGLKLGIRLDKCVNVTLQDCSMKNFMAWEEITGGSPYTISYNGSNITVQRMKCMNVFGLSSGTGLFFAQNLNLLYNVVDMRNGGGSGIDFHGNSSGVIAFNTIYNSPNQTQMISARYNNTYIHHNTLNFTDYNTTSTIKGTKGIWILHATTENMFIDSNYFNIGPHAYGAIKLISVTQLTNIVGPPNFKVRGNVTIGGGEHEFTEATVPTFEFTGNYTDGSTSATSHPPRVRFPATNYGGTMNNNTWIKRAAYTTSPDYVYYFTNPTDPTFNINDNKYYFVGTNTASPYKLHGGGYTISNEIKYSSSSAQFFEATGVVNTKTNNVVLAAVTPPTAPTHSGAGYNYPPIANAGANEIRTVSTATFNGSGTDYFGTIVSYLWTKVGESSSTITSPTSATTGITGLTTGTHTYQLQVTDNGGLTATDIVQAIVSLGGNATPVANAGADQDVTTTSVNLTGSGTDDGSIASYAWAKVSGPGTTSIPNPNNQNVTATGLLTGTYIFRLTVTDNLGVTAFDDVQVIVTIAGTIIQKIPIPTGNKIRFKKA